MSYKAIAGERQIESDGQKLEFLPCRRCSTPSSRVTLSDHGGLCLRCYEAYCHEVAPSRQYSQAETVQALKEFGKKMPGRAWAYRLRACELHYGGDLSAAGFPGPPGRLMATAQCAAWRVALKTEAA